MDRLIQPAVIQILTPIELWISPQALRSGRSQTGSALYKIRLSSMYRHEFIDFFDGFQHDILMARAARKVHDRRLLKHIRRYLRAGVNSPCCRICSCTMRLMNGCGVTSRTFNSLAMPMRLLCMLAASLRRRSCSQQFDRVWRNTARNSIRRKPRSCTVKTAIGVA